MSLCTQLYQHRKANCFLCAAQQPVCLPLTYLHQLLCNTYLVDYNAIASASCAIADQLQCNSMCLDPANGMYGFYAIAGGLWSTGKWIISELTHPPAASLPPPLNARQINEILNKNKCICRNYRTYFSQFLKIFVLLPSSCCHSTVSTQCMQINVSYNCSWIRTGLVMCKQHSQLLLWKYDWIGTNEKDNLSPNLQRETVGSKLNYTYADTRCLVWKTSTILRSCKKREDAWWCVHSMYFTGSVLKGHAFLTKLQQHCPDQDGP